MDPILDNFAMNTLDLDHARHDQSISALFTELRLSLTTILKQYVLISYR